MGVNRQGADNRDIAARRRQNHRPAPREHLRQVPAIRVIVVMALRRAAIVSPKSVFNVRTAVFCPWVQPCAHCPAGRPKEATRSATCAETQMRRVKAALQHAGSSPRPRTCQRSVDHLARAPTRTGQLARQLRQAYEDPDHAAPFASWIRRLEEGADGELRTPTYTCSRPAAFAAFAASAFGAAYADPLAIRGESGATRAEVVAHRSNGPRNRCAWSADLRR
jgi:hypothetical protein